MDLQEAKNIYLIPSQEPESIACALALFYTLKDLNKNVNLVMDNGLPENLCFLAPSLDFISYPKNFVISIPDRAASVSQIYYEKNSNCLKVRLTLERGLIKKEDISFYFAEPRPDLVVTIGINDYKEHLSGKLDSFGFLLDSPVLNISDGQNAAMSLIKGLNNGIIKKEVAECLLAGLAFCTDNFKNSKTTADVFESAAFLIKQGADLKKITDNI